MNAPIRSDVLMEMPRVRLRRATAVRHARVDDAISALGYASRKGYATMLATHAAIIPPLEATLREGGGLSDLADLDDRWRADSLMRDMDDLGVPPPRPRIMSLLNSRAEAAGVMYVLEGSRIGAREIGRRLGLLHAEKLPTRFLRHGEENGLWASFLRWLNAQAWDSDDMQAMEEGANRVFDAYLAEAAARSR